MPRYFFHIRDPAGMIRDTEGLELPSLRSAVIEADASAASIAEQRKSAPGSCQIEVRAEAGLLLAVVPVFVSS
jgi:hypothetical protein